MEFNLNKFLEFHKPIDIKQEIDRLLKLPKLKGYTLLGKGQTNKIKIGKTYIRYKSFDSNRLSRKYIVIDGGKEEKHKFTSDENQTYWANLKIQTMKDGESIVKSIALYDKFVFYK